MRTGPQSLCGMSCCPMEISAHAMVMFIQFAEELFEVFYLHVLRSVQFRYFYPAQNLLKTRVSDQVLSKSATCIVGQSLQTSRRQESPKLDLLDLFRKKRGIWQQLQACLSYTSAVYDNFHTVFFGRKQVLNTIKVTEFVQHKAVIRDIVCSCSFPSIAFIFSMLYFN